MKEKMNIQKVWDWKIAAYLFLVAMGTGAYLAGFIVDFPEAASPPLSMTTAPIATILVLLAAIFVIVDIGRRRLSYLAFTRPSTSWIARGAIATVIFFVLSLVHTILWLWSPALFKSLPLFHIIFASITALCALVTLIFSGLILGAAAPLPAWNNQFVPVLFLLSGFATGTMISALLYLMFSRGPAVIDTLIFLASFDIYLLILEILIIGIFVWRLNRQPASRNAGQLLLRGKLAGHFWGGVLVVGLLLPLFLELFKVLRMPNIKPGTVLIVTAIVVIGGIVGGYLLRYIILAAGARRPLNVKGTPVTLPDVDKVWVP